MMAPVGLNLEESRGSRLDQLWKVDLIEVLAIHQESSHIVEGNDCESFEAPAYLLRLPSTSDSTLKSPNIASAESSFQMC